MSRPIFIAVLVCFSVHMALPQEAQPAASPCRIMDFVNSSGWSIPGLSSAVVKTSHAHYANGDVENVYVDILEPANPADHITFVSLGPGTVEIRNTPVDVKQIERFTMNGHVFGYHVIGVDAGFGKDGKRVHFGFQERVYYYDPDGSGKFTVMRNAGELPFKIVVPDWVKETHQAIHLMDDSTKTH